MDYFVIWSRIVCGERHAEIPDLADHGRWVYFCFWQKRLRCFNVAAAFYLPKTIDASKLRFSPVVCEGKFPSRVVFPRDLKSFEQTFASYASTNSESLQILIIYEHVTLINAFILTFLLTFALHFFAQTYCAISFK